ncbi:MAG TPA: peptidylprolyl isomerase [Blastocatellia bacterium]|nr:peptidylprolyl isomerase [Blastocatellia bacterium]
MLLSKIKAASPIRNVSRRSGSLARLSAIHLIAAALLAPCAVGTTSAQEKKRAAEARKPDAPVTAEEAARLEAVITTDLGVIRFEFFADKAPRHVRHFINRAREGFYDGSAFFRVIARAIIQGGDPNLKDPQKPRETWGTGALSLLADEFSDIHHVRGTVSTVRVPGKANSGGSQFFICASPQPQLDGQFSAFGQVTEGIEVVDKISLAPADAQQRTVTPVKISSIKIEPKKEEPFKNASVEQMRKDVLIRTSLGDITVTMSPDLAPEHVRNFLKLVESGWYDHTAFHRVVPGFVIQGGVGGTRANGAGHPADKWVHNIKAEFSQEKHIRGVLSMARASDPDSASTSFFIVLGPAPHLDNKYSIFGRVLDGFDVLDRIERVARDGETPRERIELIEAVIKP